MSNFITIELCAEDRARIDRLIQALEKKTAQEEFSPVPTVLDDDPVRNALQRVLNNAVKGENKPLGVDETPTLPTTPNEEKTPTQEETEPTTPTRVIDRAELKALVIKLCADGKKAEYDAFWDAYQENGTRSNYGFAFSGRGWNATTLRPKYTCKPIGSEAQNMFSACYFENKNYTDLLDISHISIDVSEVTNASNMFANAKVKGVTLIFSEKITTLNNAFNKSNGGSVAGMNITLLVPNPNCNWSNAFAYHRVKELNLLEGTVIGANGFDIRYATALPHDSIVSIINALSTTTSGLSITLSKTAVDSAFATTTGGTDGSTSAEWTALVATRSNWTISLV